eukprot:jgi/Tetstr1/457783/TSEL_044328.t1
MAASPGMGKARTARGGEGQWVVFAVVAMLGVAGIVHMRMLGEDVERAAGYMGHSLRTEFSVSPLKQVDHIYHQITLTNDDDGHITHMEEVSEEDMLQREAHAAAAETLETAETPREEGADMVELAEEDVDEFDEADVLEEGRSPMAAVTVDANDDGEGRQGGTEEGWLPGDGPRKREHSWRTKARENMLVGRSRRFAYRWQEHIQQSNTYRRCGGMPDEWRASYSREPLPPLRYKKYDNATGLTLLPGSHGMHRQFFPTENGPQQAHVASNQVRLQPHESALQSCLQDLNECGDEAQLAALSLRGMQEAFRSTYKALQERHRNCALVGNSGGLMEHDYGSYIDDHDFVMRVNYMKVSTYEAHTGNRTHAQFLGHTVSRDLCCKAPIYRKWKPTAELDTIYTWYPANKEQIMRWLRRRIRSPDRIINKHSMSDEFIESATTVFKAFRGELLRLGFGPFQDWQFMTTGMHALLAMLRHCDNIDVYGFTASSRVDMRHNYHGANMKPAKREQLSDPMHSWDNERLVLRLLHATGAINLCST